MNLLKHYGGIILVAMISFGLGAVVLYTVSRIGQSNRSVAPTVPETQPQALEGSPVPECQVSFAITLPSPSPSPTPTSIPTPSPTPTPTPVAVCIGLKFYLSNWAPVPSLSALQPGTTIYVAVMGNASAGTFDQARFRIVGNGQLLPGDNNNPDGWRYSNTTLGNPNNEFSISFTLLPNVSSYTFGAEIHHVTLGWR